MIAIREQLDALFLPILWEKLDFLVPQRQEALFEAKMKKKKLVQWNFGDFSTSFEEIFYYKNAYPPFYLLPDLPVALQKGTHPP